MLARSSHQKASKATKKRGWINPRRHATHTHTTQARRTAPSARCLAGSAGQAGRDTREPRRDRQRIRCVELGCVARVFRRGKKNAPTCWFVIDFVEPHPAKSVRERDREMAMTTPTPKDDDATVRDESSAFSLTKNLSFSLCFDRQLRLSSLALHRSPLLLNALAPRAGCRRPRRRSPTRPCTAKS